MKVDTVKRPGEHHMGYAVSLQIHCDAHGTDVIFSILAEAIKTHANGMIRRATIKPVSYAVFFPKP